MRPDSFPSAFNAATGKFDQNAFTAVGNWLAGSETGTAAKPALALVDAQGAPVNLVLDANTLVVGAATWCGATAKFKDALEDPQVAVELEGLRLVFAFDDEGGDGPGGVLNAEFLDDMASADARAQSNTTLRVVISTTRLHSESGVTLQITSRRLVLL